MSRLLARIDATREDRPAAASLAIISIAVLLVLLPGGASACGCGEFRPPVVAHGVSPDGLEWQTTAIYVPDGIEEKPYLEVNFTIDPIGNGGHYYIVQLPISGVYANVDSQIERYSEGDLSGIAERRVVKLKMKMGNGNVLTVEPSLAPARLRKRFFWLSRVRFFDFFFRAPGKPRLLTAFDRDGQMLGRAKIQQEHSFTLYF